MKRLTTIVTTLAALSATSALADERAFGLDGSIYQLNPDSTYTRLSPDTTEGRINFVIDRGRENNGECELAATLSNETEHTIRLLKQCFKVVSQKGGDTVCFNFGGGRASQSIKAGETSDALGTFDKGTCTEIIGAQPYYFFSGRDPSGISIDGLAPFDARQLFHFPDSGIIKISNNN